MKNEEYDDFCVDTSVSVSGEDVSEEEICSPPGIVEWRGAFVG